MSILKGLFLGVYASNRGIRVSFAPLLNLLLATPFIALLLYYLEFDIKSYSPFKSQSSNAEILLQIFISALAFLLPTRIISGRSPAKTSNGRPRRIQRLPYWIPRVQHLGSLVFGGEGWLSGVRESSITPIVEFSAAGTKHSLIFSPSILDEALESDGLEEADISRWTALENAFNMPADAKLQYLELRLNVSKIARNKIYQGPGMEKLLLHTFSIFSDSLPDLITFNTSLVDQLPWERVAGIELTDGTAEAACDLFSLINEFFCNAIIPPITGTQFPESYQLLASDLATLNQHFYALATGLPRLVPMPGLPGAMLAKKRLLTNFTRLFVELSVPAERNITDDESLSGEETDADTPTPITALNDLFQQNHVAASERASITLQILHDIFSEVVPLACWTILHIHKSSSEAQNPTSTLIDDIRNETGVWVEGIQPPSLHPSFPAPPQISFNGTAQVVSPISFPHLRSCINESRRLYKSSIYTYKLTKPIVLTDMTSMRPGAEGKWQLEANSYLDVGLSQSLINSSSANFLAPDVYKPDRFLHATPPSSVTSAADFQEPYATALLIALVAGILQLWDISPAPKKSIWKHIQEAQAAVGAEKVVVEQGERAIGSWVVPKAVDGAGVKVPAKDARVRIRRREGLAEAKTRRTGR